MSSPNGVGSGTSADGVTPMNRVHIRSLGGTLVAVAGAGVGDPLKPLKSDVETFVAQVTRSVGLLVFAPLVLAWLIRRLHPAAARWHQHLGNLTFSAWVTAIFLITANASEFFHHQTQLSSTVLVEVAAVSLLICVVNFTVGRLIGGREFPREASQALGQKNTTFTIYLAMTYANPLIALGPTCYVLWHNLWNSWQLHRHQHRETIRLTPPADRESLPR